MPTENTFGTPSLQPKEKKKNNKKPPKRCYRTCAHPPTVCLLWLLFTVSKVSICRCVFKLPFLFICALVFRDFLCVSFSLLKQKGCSCPFYLVHCWLFPTVDALTLFTSAVFSGWTMRCCILFSVSIFLVVVLSCNVKQQSWGFVFQLHWGKKKGFASLPSSLPGSCRKDFFFFFEQFYWGFSL